MKEMRNVCVHWDERNIIMAYMLTASIVCWALW